MYIQRLRLFARGNILVLLRLYFVQHFQKITYKIPNKITNKIRLLLSQIYAWLIQELNLGKKKLGRQVSIEIRYTWLVKFLLSKHQSHIMKVIDKIPSKFVSFFSFT